MYMYIYIYISCWWGRLFTYPKRLIVGHRSGLSNSELLARGKCRGTAYEMMSAVNNEWLAITYLS